MWKSVKTPAVTGFLAVYDMGKACSEPARDRGKTKREAARKAQSSVSAAKCGKERKTDALWKKQAKGADCGKAVFFALRQHGLPSPVVFSTTTCQKTFHSLFFQEIPAPERGSPHPGEGFSTWLGCGFPQVWESVWKSEGTMWLLWGKPFAILFFRFFEDSQETFLQKSFLSGA